MSSLRVVVLDPHLDVWVYGYKITFPIDVEDLVEACTYEELETLLEYETHE